MRVQPRSSREAIGGTREGALVVKVTAPPVEGQANAAVARLIGKVMGVPPSAVTLLRGSTGRDKLVHVAGLDRDDARARLIAAGRPR